MLGTLIYLLGLYWPGQPSALCKANEEERRQELSVHEPKVYALLAAPETEGLLA